MIVANVWSIASLGYQRSNIGRRAAILRQRAPDAIAGRVNLILSNMPGKADGNKEDDT
jgi:hypothetical protein